MPHSQHSIAERLLPKIIFASIAGSRFSYADAAQMLRRPRNHGRMIAQVCDLIDAVAAHARLPSLALVTVTDCNGLINQKAWAETPRYRKAIIERAENYQFTKTDYKTMTQTLSRFEGCTNKSAWRQFWEKGSQRELYRELAGRGANEVTSKSKFSNAIEDWGVDEPTRAIGVTSYYERDQRVRNAVIERANGRCELCGAKGFKKPDGSFYLESHHVIALAKEGADRITNVIALCPMDHREAHFGARRVALENKMIEKLNVISAKAQRK